MEIRDITHIFTKHWMLIAIVTAVALVVAAVITFYFMDDVYESTAVMIISLPRNASEQSPMTLNDYNLNLKLVESYRVLCKTDRILNQVLAVTNLPLTTQALSDKINVSAQSDTEIISINVMDSIPDKAALIANAVATVFEKEIPQIMKMDNVQIIDTAVVPQVPVKPDRKMILAIAGLLGLLLGFGVSLMIEYFDVTIKSAGQLSELLGAPVLGIIPQLSGRDR